MTTTTYTTRPCFRCRQSSTVEVSAEGLALWQAGELIQNAFPDMTSMERELLISGFHPVCWEEVFGRDD